ncbi:MAG: group 1 truncated hemoglobin [Rickettsiales bacterium]|jgi:hemoglobin
MASLYDRIGGESTIDAVVPMFYRKVMGDARVNIFFEGVDINKLAIKMKIFLTMALVGASGFNTKNLRDAHSNLVDEGLNNVHFDVFVKHLGDTLNKLSISKVDAEEVIAIVNRMRDDVLCKN